MKVVGSTAFRQLNPKFSTAGKCVSALSTFQKTFKNRKLKKHVRKTAQIKALPDFSTFSTSPTIITE